MARTAAREGHRKTNCRGKERRVGRSMDGKSTHSRRKSAIRKDKKDKELREKGFQAGRHDAQKGSYLYDPQWPNAYKEGYEAGYVQGRR